MNKSSFKRFALYGSIAITASLGTLLAVRASAAGIPEADVMTYTGYLEDGDGQPLSGDHSVEVSFWESEEATSDLCTGSNAAAPGLQSGRFQVALPQECADAVKASPNIWSSVKVDGGELGRTKLGAVPFAIEAGHATAADEATHATSADKADSASGGLATELDGLAEQLGAVPKITSWTNFTNGVVLAGATATTGVQNCQGRWRRVGDSMEVQLTTRFSADVVSSEYLAWQLPTNVKPIALADGAIIGTGEAWNGSVSTACMVGLSTNQRVQVDCQGVSALTRSQVGVGGKWQYVGLSFTVRIEGWTLTTP